MTPPPHQQLGSQGLLRGGGLEQGKGPQTSHPRSGTKSSSPPQTRHTLSKGPQGTFPNVLVAKSPQAQDS